MLWAKNRNSQKYIHILRIGWIAIVYDQYVFEIIKIVVYDLISIFLGVLETAL